MRIAPINTKADYDATLAEIASLMDAEQNTARGVRLNILVALVEAYEEKHEAIDAPDPTRGERSRT